MHLWAGDPEARGIGDIGGLNDRGDLWFSR